MTTLRHLLVLTACVAGGVGTMPASGAEAEGHQAQREAIAAADNEFTVGDLLPIAWQKRPKLRFNVITEMMPAGRERRVPTPAAPMYYHSVAPMQGTFGPLLQQRGEQPPPAAEIEAAMKKALAENGYLPVTDDHPQPDVLILFHFGSNGISMELPIGAVAATEVLSNVLMTPGLAAIMVERTRFIAGEKVAQELSKAIHAELTNLRMKSGPINPAFGSPFQIFLWEQGVKVEDLVDLAFLPAYVATATAFDFAGVEQKKKIPLWQTRMVISARGVTMDEVLTPLIQNTAPFIGRETEAITVQKRLNRDGHVEIGTAEMVRDTAPGVTPATAAPAEKR